MYCKPKMKIEDVQGEIITEEKLNEEDDAASNQTKSALSPNTVEPWISA